MKKNDIYYFIIKRYNKIMMKIKGGERGGSGM